MVMEQGRMESQRQGLGWGREWDLGVSAEYGLGLT